MNGEMLVVDWIEQNWGFSVPFVYDMGVLGMWINLLGISLTAFLMIVVLDYIIWWFKNGRNG